MIIQTVSLRTSAGKYLSCRQNGILKFDATELDPSCKFFMVPSGAGRTSLRGPNGKFLDLHSPGDRFLCDGITVGVGFIFSDTMLKLDNGKYLSDTTSSDTIVASTSPTALVIKATSFESFGVNMSLSVPAIFYQDVLIDDRYRPGKSYLVLNTPSAYGIDIVFSIPYIMEGERDRGTVELILEHMRDATGGIISVTLNNLPVFDKYSSTPTSRFEAQNLGSWLLKPLDGENKFSIRLAKGYPGNYYFSGAALVFKDSGSSYNNGHLEDTLSVGKPYLSIEGGTSWSKISFTVREELLGIGGCILKVQHRREPGTSIDIFLNGSRIISDYDTISTITFNTSQFLIHSSDLKRNNELVIKPRGGKYYVADVNVEVVSLLPDVTEANFKTYIKDWILRHRSNIGQLNQIPRSDLSAWKFVSEAPYWFFIPFLPCSPEEIGVLFDYYNMLFVSVAFEVRDINDKARQFHLELWSTDLPRKNALRHAYWTAMLSRRFSMFFALDLSTAHEEAHTDLTIEGPFDHVTDKINNAVGSLLGLHTPRTKDLSDAVDEAWERGELAFAKNFRETASGQTAQISWQKPLDVMASKYNVKPNFSQSEKDTLQRMKVNVPNVPVIHD